MMNGDRYNVTIRSKEKVELHDPMGLKGILVERRAFSAFLGPFDTHKVTAIISYTYAENRQQ